MPPTRPFWPSWAAWSRRRGYADDFEAGFDTDQVISALVSRLVAGGCLIDA